MDVIHVLSCEGGLQATWKVHVVQKRPNACVPQRPWHYVQEVIAHSTASVCEGLRVWTWYISFVRDANKFEHCIPHNYHIFNAAVLLLLFIYFSGTQIEKPNSFGGNKEWEDLGSVCSGGRCHCWAVRATAGRLLPPETKVSSTEEETNKAVTLIRRGAWMRCSFTQGSVDLQIS